MCPWVQSTLVLLVIEGFRSKGVHMILQRFEISTLCKLDIVKYLDTCKLEESEWLLSNQDILGLFPFKGELFYWCPPSCNGYLASSAEKATLSFIQIVEIMQADLPLNLKPCLGKKRDNFNLRYTCCTMIHKSLGTWLIHDTW